MLYLYTASLKNFENYDFDNDSKYSNIKLLAKDNSEIIGSILTGCNHNVAQISQKTYWLSYVH